MLRLTAVGNLGADAELRYTTKNTPIAQFRIAINQVRVAADGEREESTEWVRVSVAGRQATFASQSAKGQRVVVVGRLEITHFDRRDGTRGTGLDLWADDVVNVSGRTTVAQGSDALPPDQPHAVHRSPEAANDDELPF
jgi:single-strand DNA-binding protein